MVEEIVENCREWKVIKNYKIFSYTTIDDHSAYGYCRG